MSDNQGAAGAAQDGNQAGAQDAGASATNANDGQQGAQPQTQNQQPSANQLIKTFAEQRGVTVAKLLEQFESMENAGKTELQRLEADRDSWKGKAEAALTKAQELLARSAVTEAATKANAKHPTLIYRAVKDDLNFDDEGNVTNIDAVLKELKAEAPDLFPAANGSGDGGKGTPASNVANVNDLFREMARTAT